MRNAADALPSRLLEVGGDRVGVPVPTQDARDLVCIQPGFYSQRHERFHVEDRSLFGEVCAIEVFEHACPRLRPPVSVSMRSE